VILAGSIIITTYLIAIGILLFGYQKIEEFIPERQSLLMSENEDPNTHFSILIPFRNESKVLPDLLKSIKQLNYPFSLFEIIFVDDESEDNSIEVILKELNDPDIPFRIINNNRKSDSPKKDAITEAIEASKYEWILTTDADCILPENWLTVFDNYIQKNNPIMLVGPVRYFNGKGIINQYQRMDNFSLQTTTIGGFGLKSPLLCNGANLAYRKEDFMTVSGFLENNHIASGDDIFLMEKFKKLNPEGVHYIKNKDVVVITSPQENWKGIISQRIRWASKTSHQKNRFAKLLGFVVFNTNLFLIVSGLYSLFENTFIPFFISFLLFKVFLDYLILFPIAIFFRSKINIPVFLLNSLIYPIITIIVVFGSLKGSYSWKGRAFNK